MSSQRLKKRAHVESDDEFEGSSTQQTQTQSTSTQMRGGGEMNGYLDEEELDRKVKNIIRYALACEFKKKAIRREEITKITLDNQRMPFGIVMSAAREKLNKTFGMDMFELPTAKEKTNQSQTQATNRNAESSTQAAESSTQAARRSGTSGTFILRNNLKESYNTPDIISQTTTEYKRTGILYIILSLIFLNGHSMTSPDLYGHMDRLRLTKSRSDEIEDREKILEYFIKNNYLRRTKKPDTSGDEQEFDFTWGPRSKIEFPTSNVVNFMLSFYNASQEEKKDLETKMYKQGGYEVG